MAVLVLVQVLAGQAAFSGYRVRRGWTWSACPAGQRTGLFVFALVQILAGWAAFSGYKVRRDGHGLLALLCEHEAQEQNSWKALCWRRQVLLALHGTDRALKAGGQQHSTWRRVVLRLHMLCRTRANGNSLTIVCM